MTQQTIQPEAYIYFKSDSNRRVFHPLTVLARQGKSWTVAAHEADLAIEIDQEVTIFFELRQGFMQQSARVNAQHGDIEGCEFEIELLGEPCSAESRECYRALTVVSDRWVDLGDEPERCQMVDVSNTGCAIISQRAYQVGAVIPGAMIHNGIEYRGSLSVRSSEELSRGRIRYGLFCIENRDSDENLAKGLRLVCMDVQRAQLRRLSGVA